MTGLAHTGNEKAGRNAQWWWIDGRTDRLQCYIVRCNKASDNKNERVTFTKRRQERRKHCALAVVRRIQKISPRSRPLPGGAGRPKFNQLEMVTTFTYTEDRCTQFRVIMVTDPQTNTPTNTQTHTQTIQYNYNTLRRNYLARSVSQLSPAVLQ